MPLIRLTLFGTFPPEGKAFVIATAPFCQEQSGFETPSDEGGAEQPSEAEGEITKRNSNTPLIDSSRILSAFFHGIESILMVPLFRCVISPPRT